MSGNFVVFVPLQEEMKYAYEHLKDKLKAKCSLPYHENTSNYVFRFTRSGREEGRVQLVVIGDMGNTYTLGRIAPIISSTSPHVCFLVGIAGSLQPNQGKLGSVVVASRAKAWFADKVKSLNPALEEVRKPSDMGLENPDKKILIDERKTFLDGTAFFRFRRMYARQEASETIVSDYVHDLQNKKPLDLRVVSQNLIPGLPNGVENLKPSVLEGTIFSSEMVVDSEEFVKFLLERDEEEQHKYDYYHQRAPGGVDPRQQWFPSQLLAVDMESFGFLTMAQQSKGIFAARHYIAVRGISDLALNKEQLDRDTGIDVRKIAVQNAVEVALDMIDYMISHNLGA